VAPSCAKIQHAKYDCILQSKALDNDYNLKY